MDLIKRRCIKISLKKFKIELHAFKKGRTFFQRVSSCSLFIKWILALLQTDRATCLHFYSKFFNSHIRETWRFTKHIITRESIGLDLSAMGIHTPFKTPRGPNFMTGVNSSITANTLLEIIFSANRTHLYLPWRPELTVDFRTYSFTFLTHLW